ncbi:hypothetical protein [Desulfotomaculum sp. 1211_IL3151]|uniref:hypothetical protein n=1 Tax=Desulfotomaculum sp. 1211_IL3151 TaxID=3084055 RepID=UPI002FD9DD23
MKHIEHLVDRCSDDHTIKQAFQNYKHLFWVNTFLSHLNKALEKVYQTNKRAYNDFVQNKIPAVSGASFNKHSLISSLCEISIMNTFICQSECPESLLYEPKLRSDNKKNVEFSIQIKGVKYNIEVKSPNLSNYYSDLESKIEKHGVVTRFDTRAFGKPEQVDQMPSPGIRVKDFLVDASLKFPNSNLPKQVNILFIAWDDHTDQPCIELQHPIHGLLTQNSWHKDNDGHPILFSNINLIFISDLYQNIIAHLSSGDIPLPSFLTGVPYFERNCRFPPNQVNPFFLPYSRNVLVKPTVDLEDPQIREIIFNIPVAFSDQSVDMIDEEYVAKYGTDIKISFK